MGGDGVGGDGVGGDGVGGDGVGVSSSFSASDEELSTSQVSLPSHPHYDPIAAWKAANGTAHALPPRAAARAEGPPGTAPGTAAGTSPGVRVTHTQRVVRLVDQLHDAVLPEEALLRV